MKYLITSLDNFLSDHFDADDYKRFVPVLHWESQEQMLLACQVYLRNAEARFRDLESLRLDPIGSLRVRSLVIDNLVLNLFHNFQQPYIGKGLPRWALCAVGGYGREEMGLYSDVDLLFLIEKPDGRFNQIFEQLLYVLWDLRLEIGHATRTVSDCKSLAREDQTIMTSLLNLRFLSGDEKIFRELEQMRNGELSSGLQRKKFLKSKMIEREERIKKFGGSVFLLEPNLKEGPGGLRDLHLIRWVAQALGVHMDFDHFSKTGVLRDEEERSLSFAFRFLSRLRNQLHLETGKKTDQLTFDVQVNLAERMGFVDEDIPAVERFMQVYYTIVFQVKKLTDKLLSQLIENKSGISRFFGKIRTKKIDRDFNLQGNQIVVRGGDVFKTDPVNLIRIFFHVQQTCCFLHPATEDLVRQHLYLVDDEFRTHPDVTDLFRRMMASPQNLHLALFAMHDANFFENFIPEFSNLRNRVQHDIYHLYTVDTHSIFAIKELSQLVSGDYQKTFPTLMNAVKETRQIDLLSFGILFHDIGKGLGGNHSVKGAKLAKDIMLRLHYPEESAATVEFLVKSHLIMTHLSQRRDLEDPGLISEFASSMKNLDNLNMLSILTWADVRAVSQESWTDWKGRLLEDLYKKTRSVLEGQHLTQQYFQNRVSDVREGILNRLGTCVDRSALEKFLQNISPRYVLAHNDEEISEHFRLLQEEIRDGFFFRETSQSPSTVSELLIYVPSNPRVLPLVTGVMLATGVSILTLEAFTLTDGFLLIKMLVQTEMCENLKTGGASEQVKNSLIEVFTGKTKVGDLIARRKRPDFLLRKPVQKAKTKVEIDNDVSAYYTVIDIYTHDRLGLLYDIMTCLASHGCYVEVSKISTKVEQVVDSFYVKDIFGHKIVSNNKLREIRDALVLIIDPPMPEVVPADIAISQGA